MPIRLSEMNIDPERLQSLLRANEILRKIMQSRAVKNYKMGKQDYLTLAENSRDPAGERDVYINYLQFSDGSSGSFQVRGINNYLDLFSRDDTLKQKTDYDFDTNTTRLTGFADAALKHADPTTAVKAYSIAHVTGTDHVDKKLGRYAENGSTEREKAERALKIVGLLKENGVESVGKPKQTKDPPHS